jgi:hypothetical protein
MKIKERILYVKDLLADSIVWGDKRKIYMASVIIGLIIGGIIRFFIYKK